MGHLFLKKCSKFDIHFRNKAKNSEKYIFKKIIAFELVAKNDLLRREYLSSAVNMLTNSPKI